ncbi:MAG: metallophosphoesterase family protein [Lachnospiraceae bacterium]|nr:metallophosphoesterase family protein [Lachnospiraceae bacterium]
MKLAVISDIHGNYKAFEAFLAYIEDKEVDAILCLGDYVTDAPYPQRTMDLLFRMMEKYTCYMVRGNREQYLIDNFYHPQGWKPSSANGMLYYTAEHITAEQIHFFEGLPFARELCLPECPPMIICHGTPEDLRGNFVEEPQLRETVLKSVNVPYLFGGHSHNQEIECRYGTTYVNPGSLGGAIDGVGKLARFAMLETVEREGEPAFEVELITIPYDIDSYLQDFKESGLDECGGVLAQAVKKNLLTGINYFYQSVVEAGKISGKPISEVSEETWEQVAQKLGF